jgi:two-component system sensor histidine kinase YesM
MMRMIKQMYNSHSQRIQVRLTLYFLLILIPLVGVSLFANFKSTDILEGQTSERTKNSLRSVLDQVDLAVQDLENLSALISTDYSIKPVLHEADQVLLPEDLYGFYSIMERLTNITAINGNLKEISLLHAPSGLWISTQYGGKRLDYTNTAWFQSVLQAKGKTILYVPEKEEEAVLGANAVSFMRLMDVHNQDNTSNVLILSISKEKLLEMIKSIRLTSNSSVYLYSPEGELIAGTNQAYPVHPWKHLQEDEVGRTDEGMLVWSTTSARSGWSLVMIQPEEEIYLESNQLSDFTNLIIMISIVMALLIPLGVYKGISAPLTELLHGMKQMRLGKFNTRLPNRRKDEFGALTEAFNQMIADQQMLIRDVYEHQLQLSKTELKFLHSQINPHFLYNTLDSIYWTAKNYDADEISEMVLNLSRFFRLSLGKGRETFTVEETVEHLMYYLRVQQFRFMDQFTVRFDIEESVKPILVLKLLLQPIVENSILHGLEKRGSGGELVISCTLEHEMLCLKVSDNGAGIPEERLHFIRSEMEHLDHQERFASMSGQQVNELFGLRNVLGRMKLYYGTEAKLIIDSRVGSGTSVTLQFPIVQSEEKLA